LLKMVLFSMDSIIDPIFKKIFKMDICSVIF
jgi:hypothetical protein